MGIDETWYQIFIADPEYATGDSVAAFATKLSEMTFAPFVEVHKSAELLPFFEDTINSGDCIYTPISSFLTSIRRISQIDWAFFFFTHTSLCPNLLNSTETLNCIQMACYTIQIMDNSYFILYTNDPNLVNKVGETWVGSEIIKGPVKSLEIPF